MAGGEREVDVVEHDEWASDDGEGTGDERCGHEGTSENRERADGGRLTDRSSPKTVPHPHPESARFVSLSAQIRASFGLIRVFPGVRVGGGPGARQTRTLRCRP